MAAKILILDDEAGARQVIENFLIAEGYELRFAANGVEGLDLARAWQPDVILSDVMMPVMDGLEFCRQIRADPALGQVPILLITALNDRQSKLNGLQAGADDFLTKPAEAYELRARLRTITRLDRFRKLNDERARLEAESSRRHILFEESPDGILIIDPQTGGFVEFNTAAHTQLGYTREAFAELRLFDIEAQESSEETREHIRAVIAHGRSDFETLQRTRQGELRHVYVTAQVVPILGQPVLYCIWRDITERKRAEAQLRRNEQILRLFVEHSPASIAMFDRDMRYIITSRRYLADFRLGDQDLTGRSHYDVFPEMDEARRAIHRRCLAGAVVRNEEDPLPRIDGSLDWVRYELRPWYEADGSIGGLIFFSEVITERKQAEQELRKSEEKYRSLLASLESVVASVDGDGRFLYVNEMAAWQLGEPAETLVGRTMFDLFPEPVADQQMAHIRQVIREDRAMVNESPSLIRGQPRWYRTSIQPVHDQTGQVTHALINSTDIHSLKMAEAALQQRLAAEKVVAEIAQQFVNITIDNHTAIIQSALASLGMQVGVDRCYLFSYHPEEDVFTNAHEWCADGIAPSHSVGRRLRTTDHPLMLQPILRGAVINVPRVGDLPQGDPGVAIIQAQGITSLLCLPLTGEKSLLGLIGFDAISHEHPWQESEIHLLSIVGRIIANGLERLQYEREILAFNQSLEQHVYERTEALRQSQASLQAVLDTASDLIQTLDETGHYVYVNHAWCEALGYTPDEARNLSMWQVLDPTYHAHCEHTLHEILTTGAPQSLEVVFRSRQGQAVIVEGRISVRQELDGRRLTNGFFRDVTQRKQAEDTLKKRDLQLRTLFNVLPDQIIRFRRDGSILDYTLPPNLKQQPLPERLLTSHVEGNGHPTITHDVRQWLEQAFATPHLLHTHHLRLNDNDAQQIFEARLVAGNAEEAICVLRDITESEQAGETLRRANAELARAMRMKDEFLANMSHELRTPLNAILALSEILLEEVRGTINEHQQKYLRNIDASGRHLLALINDLLDLSKIEAGKLELQIEPVSVDDVCQASLLFVRELALKRRLLLTYVNPMPAIHINADVKRLKQMLVNLLSNAVKFTPEGGRVQLTVTVKPADQRIELAVQDTGIGISAENMGRLFQPFTQLDSTLARHHEGTGLGLALVKRLAGQHGGRVYAESAGVPGQGSCFTIVLPYTPAPTAGATTAVAPAALAPLADVPAPQSHTVLVVEDNEVNITVLTEYLEYHGYRCRAARTGPEALALALAEPPDVILMDIQLPEIDGLAVTRRLRADPRLAATPIIAVTALAMTGDRERCLAAGATDYLAKPLNLKELTLRMARLLAPSPG